MDYKETIPFYANSTIPWYGLAQLGYLPPPANYFGTTCPSSGITPASAISGISIGLNYSLGLKYGSPISFKLSFFKHPQDIGLWSCTMGRNSLWGGSDGEWAWYNVSHLGFWHNKRASISFLDGHAASHSSSEVSAMPSWFFSPWNDN